jgi:FkbM family methyltransferase
MSEPWMKRQFDVLEMSLVSLAIGLCVWLVAQQMYAAPQYTDAAAVQELNRLRVRYGPNHYSQFHEEWIIRDFFGDKREGVFVDVGANHYRDGSTTYYLEEDLGWSGVAIDPQSEFESGYRSHRPRSRFFPFFVSDVSNQTAKLYMVNAESQTVSASPPPQGASSVSELSAPTVTLTDLLDRLGTRRVDLLSIDVEGAEPKVLAGFDVGRFKPALVCIEAHADVRQQILEYFARHAYVVVGKYLQVDTLNLYFSPLGPAE